MKYTVDFEYPWQEGLVSIIIPVHNRQFYILETLKSISSQTYQNIEVLLIDDHSTDNSVKIIKDYISNYPNIFFLFESDGYGGCYARNFGLRKARGEYIQFFDDDDIMCPNYISFRVDKLKIENVEYVACDFVHFKNDVNNIMLHMQFSKIPHNIVSHLYHTALQTQCFLIKRSTFTKIGEWNEDVKRFQDVAYFHRLFLFNIKGIWLQKELFYYRLHDDTISVKAHNARDLIFAYNKIEKEWIKEERFDEIKTIMKYVKYSSLIVSLHDNKKIFISTVFKNLWSFLYIAFLRKIFRFDDSRILSYKI